LSYESIEAKIQTLLQALTIFDDEDVTRGDFRILDQPGGPKIVLTPGGFRPTGAATSYAKKQSYFWDTVLDLYICVWGDGSEFINLISHRQTVLDKLNQYDISLGGLTGVQYSAVTDGEPPYPSYDDAGSLTYLRQRIIIETHEKVDVSGGEYPA